MLLSEMGRHHQGVCRAITLVWRWVTSLVQGDRSQNGSSEILCSVFRGFTIHKADLKSICGIK